MNAILFPGQGVQTVGMMDSLFSSSEKAKDLFIKASDAIDIDLVELVTDDSNNLIDLTEYSQPIILASSIAFAEHFTDCLLYTSPSPRDVSRSRMPSSA